jgi:23S rRNA pseudouridine1911/1915/1917 synthase
MSNLEISRAPRLDTKVVEMVPQLSRAYVLKLIDEGKVTVDGKVATKGGQKIKGAEVIMVDYDVDMLAQIPDIDLPILYEDDDCLVINKPAGILTHSKGVFNAEATVSSFVTSHIVGDSEVVGSRAGIVHRLDRATSGVIICAKNANALAQLQKQFSQRKVKKTYHAIVTGVMDPPEAVIDMPIERNPKKPQMFRVGAGGKSAVTHYKVLQTTDKYSLLELKPETGRTHQLRVHLLHQKHPIVGDTFYGGEVADRLFLHASELEITLPNRTRQIFTAPLPKVFNDFLEHE